MAAPTDLPRAERSAIGEHLGEPARVRPPGLLVRLVVALCTYGVVALVASVGRNTLGGAEADLADVVSQVPDEVTQALVALTQLLASLLPLLLLAALVARRRWRRLIIATVASQIAIVTYGWVDSGLIDRPGDLLLDELLPVAGAIGDASFPSDAWLAGVVTLMLLCDDALPRPWRRTAVWTVGLAVGLRIASGTGLALDLLLAWTHGWIVTVLTRLTLGIPSKMPSPGELWLALSDVGITVDRLRPVRSARPGRLLADGATGPLFLKVRSADDRDADRLYRRYQRLRYQGLGELRTVGDLRSLVEQEALASWAAERAGVRTPATVGLTAVGDDSVVLAQDAVGGATLEELVRRVPGVPAIPGGPDATSAVGARDAAGLLGDDLATLDPGAELDDRMLRDLWRQVAVLRRHRIAHRALRPDNVVVDRDGTCWIVDFSDAVVGAGRRALDLDVVEGLVSLSMSLPAERVVAAAVAELGGPVVAGVVPLLQPAALTPATRGELRRGDATLEQVRACALDITGTPPQALEQLQRITMKSVLGLAVAFLGLYVLLPQLADLGQTVEAFGDADWRWAPGVIVFAFVTFGAATVSQLGAVPDRVPWGPMLRAQLASAFVGKLGPANVGGMALNVRVLQKAGVDSATASAGVGLNQLAGVVVHVGLLIGFVLWSGRTDRLAGLSAPDDEIVIALVVIVVLALALSLSPLGRRLLQPAIRFFRSAAGAVVRTLRDPVRVLALLGGSAGITLSNLFALALTLQAFGGGVAFPSLGAAYLAAAAVANVAPTPGGLGPLEATLVVLLSGAGLDNATAVSVTLSFRLATYWLPILPGWFVFELMQRRGEV